MKKHLILSFLISQILYSAPRIETEQLNLPDANLNTITIEDELITKKLEVTESAIICNDAYLCNLTVGDTFSITGSSELTNLTVTGDTLLNDGSVIGNFTIDGTLLVNSPATLNSLTIINDTDIGCNLTVGCNIYTQDSNFSIGNYYKGGTLWLHNFGINNTFLGKNAGNLTITGGQNVGIGNRSLTVLSAGNNNTAVGEVAGKNITTGSSNTALGSGALGDLFSLKNLIGSENTAIGNLALTSLDLTGNRNTAVGQGVMVLATTASNNTALGQGSLPAITTGSSNIAIGVSAGGIVTNGSGNIYINANAAIAAEVNTIRIGTGQTRNFQVGIRGVTPTNTNTALVSIDSANQLGTGIIYNDANFADTTSTQGAILKNGIPWLHNAGTTNVFLGRNAGNLTVGGNYNIGIGENSTNSITSGSDNIGIGFNALNGITNGTSNIAIGSNTLDSISAGNSAENIAIGKNALTTFNGGFRNIAIGFDAGSTLTGGSNNIYIGNPGAGFPESGVIRIGAGGTHTNVITAGNLTAAGNLTVNNQIFIPSIANTSGGGTNTVSIDLSGQLYRFTSSKRFKKNIQPITDQIAAQFIQLQPVSFNDINDNNSNPQTIYGLIAEDVNQIMPELVTYDEKNQPLSISYSMFYALLLKLIQDHDKKINALEADENVEKSGKTDTKTIKLIKTELADHSSKLNTQESIISQLKTKIENQDRVIESLISDVALLKAIIESVSKTTKIAK